MRDFGKCYIHNSNVASEKKKSNKVEKSTKHTECRCFPPFVKVHHLDCPLVAWEEPCPIHGGTHRSDKLDSCMVVALHRNLKNEGFLYPVQTIFTGENKSKASTINKHYYQNRVKSQEVQTNAEELKKSRYYFDNSCCLKKTDASEKCYKLKKFKRCFHSPCDSVAPASTSEKVDEVSCIVRKNNNVSLSVDNSSEKIVELDPKQDIDWYYLKSGKNNFYEKNKIIGFLRKNEVQFDAYNENACQYYGKDEATDDMNRISQFNRYFMYPTLNATEPSKGPDHTPRNTKHKFEQEEFVSVDGNEQSSPRDEDGKNEVPREEIDYGTDDQGQSEISGSDYFTPYVLIPDGYEKSTRNERPAVDQEVQTLDTDDLTLRKEHPSLRSIATSAISPMTEDKGVHTVLATDNQSLAETAPSVKTVNDLQRSPLANSGSVFNPPQYLEAENKDASTQISRSLISALSFLNDPETSPSDSMNYVRDTQSNERTSLDKDTSIDFRIPNPDTVKQSEAVQVPEPQNEEILIAEKMIVRLNGNNRISDNNEVKSVKVQTLMNLSRQPSSERILVAPKSSIIEKTRKKSPVVSLNKNGVPSEVREGHSKPLTSYKLIQTSISITTTMPQPGCYCSVLINPDQKGSMKSVSPSNDTYIVKHYPSIESNPSTENEIQKWLHKANSDSKLYNEKRNCRSKSQETIIEDEECDCDESCNRSICPLDENVQMKNSPVITKLKESSPPPSNIKNVAQSSPLSDLSELRKIIDQGFDRMTNEMKEICDCKQRKITKPDIVVLVERGVMTDDVEYPKEQKSHKKGIHFVDGDSQTTFDLIDKEMNVKSRGSASPNRVNILQSVPKSEFLNPGDVLVCKLCANDIKNFSKDVSTNTENPKFTSAEERPVATQLLQITNSTTVKKLPKKDSPLAENTPVSQKLQLSVIPAPHKHHCFDINDPDGLKASPQTKLKPQHPWMPTSPTLSYQKSQGSSTPKSTSPREKRKNANEIVKASTPDPSIKSNNSGRTPQVVGGLKSNVTSGQRAGTTTRNPTTLRPTTKQTQRKNPSNFMTFPVRISSLRHNQYIGSLQEEILKHYQSQWGQSLADSVETEDPNFDNCEGDVVENSDVDEFDLKECIILRPTKSDSCSCQRANPINFSKKGKESPMKTRGYFWVQPNSNVGATLHEGVECPYEKVIKSDEALKKKNGKIGTDKKKKFEIVNESARSDKTAGDTCRRSTGNSNFSSGSTRQGKPEKYFFGELINFFDPKIHALNFKERILRNSSLPDNPFSNDGDSTPQEFTEEEEEEDHEQDNDEIVREAEEETRSQKENSNMEEGD